jgi:phosphoglycerate dehydrogenase-like enzyme
VLAVDALGDRDVTAIERSLDRWGECVRVSQGMNALITRLRRGDLVGVGPDVFAAEPLPGTSPLWEMENVVITPHAAGQLAAVVRRLAAPAAENLQRWHRGEALRNVVLRGPSGALR